MPEGDFLSDLKALIQKHEKPDEDTFIDKVANRVADVLAERYPAEEEGKEEEGKEEEESKEEEGKEEEEESSLPAAVHPFYGGRKKRRSA